MNENTKAAYQSLAANFYQRLDGPPTPKKLADALKACASEYRPGYWKKLRAAIVYDQERQGFEKAAERVKATKRPDGTVPPRQRRAKGVSLEDTQTLSSHLLERGDRQAWAALTVARWTGARPAEMPGVRMAGDQVMIEGVKKSHEGQRGADRVVTLDDPEGLDQVREAVAILEGAEMGPIQDRISGAGRRLWPQRKAVPSLYSWRHQVGSDLKASGLDRKTVAYLMGHQATESVEVYGRRNRGGKSALRVGQGADLDQVRETHSEPPSARQGASQELQTDNFDKGEKFPSFDFSEPGPVSTRTYGKKGP